MSEENIQTRGYGLLVGGSALVGITVAVVCLRLWARFGILKRGGMDDFLMVLATVRCPAEVHTALIYELTSEQIASIGHFTTALLG